MTAVVRAAERLDRLPPSRFHVRVMWLVGMGMFFDSFDNTLSGSVLASMLASGFSTLSLNSIFLSASFVGLAIGAAFAGWLSDKYGRSFAFQFNLALFGILALCCAAAPSMPWLIAIRAVMSVGMGAEYVMCYGLVTEFMPQERRGRYLGILGIFAGVGVSSTSLIGMVVIPALSWRAMFVIGGLGTLVVWWLRRSLPESPRWLEAVGRTDEAEAVMRAIEREAGVSGSAAGHQGLPEAQIASAPEWVPITVLFKPPVIQRTLLAVVLNVTCLFGSYSITGWMPTFFIKQGMSVSKSLGFNAAMMAGYIAGPLLYSFIGSRITRRHGLIVAGVLCAIFAAVYPFLAAPAAVIVCGFFLVAAVASFLVLGLGATPEFFHTQYRFRGGGVAQTAGRIGLILSPFIILALFERYGIGGVIGAISGMYVLVTLLVMVAKFDAPSLKHEDGDQNNASGVVADARHIPSN